jgi:hypothetical protein
MYTRFDRKGSEETELKRKRDGKRSFTGLLFSAWRVPNVIKDFGLSELHTER